MNGIFSKLYWFNWPIALGGAALTFLAGNSIGRLNVPDSAAGPMDYGMFAGLPLLGSFVLALVRLKSRTAATVVRGTAAAAASGTAALPSRSLIALGKEASDMIAANDLEGAQKILNAARTATGKAVPVVPAMLLVALLCLSG